MLRQPHQVLEREVLYDRQGKVVTSERLVITYRADSGVDACFGDQHRQYQSLSNRFDFFAAHVIL